MHQLLSKILLISLIAFFSLLFLPGCEKNYDNVVDSTGSAPILYDANFSLTVINTDTINVGQVRSPDDVLTIRGIAKVKVIHSESASEINSVNCSVIKDQISSPLGQGTLHNDGIYPDQSANDSIYSGYVYFQIRRADIGEYWIELWSENSSGWINSSGQHYKSDMAFLSFQVIRQNHPPVISNLEADSLVSLGGVDHELQLRITVTDPDGLSDIRKVFFNTFKPDGSPSSTNPQPMYDDGDASQISGDKIADDGIFGLKISLPRNTVTGTYRFEFQAVDKSLAYSNTIIRNIVITK